MSSSKKSDDTSKIGKSDGKQKNSINSNTDLPKSSLVNAIIDQSEKESGYSASTNQDNSKREKLLRQTEEGTKKAQALLSFSKSALTLIIIISLGIWLYFFAMLDQGNFFHEKLSKQNLATQVDYKTNFLKQIKDDSIDVKKFNKLLKVESLINRIIEIDMENPVLNYKRPQGEKVKSRKDGEVNTMLKTVDIRGNIVYLLEAEILSLENARDVKVDFVKNSLLEILQKCESLKQEINVGSKIEDDLKELFISIEMVTPEEENFPSATTKEYYSAAKSIAQKILLNVKDMNLKNLVTDIKKQAEAIDISTTDADTRATISTLRNIIKKISVARVKSFEQALQAASKLNTEAITDHKIYQKVTTIINTSSHGKEKGDLEAAAVIAKNLGKVNTINALKANRISWSTIIDRIKKIIRLGADLERDTRQIIIKDVNTDIDPNGEFVDIVGYSGKSIKNEIEVRGYVSGSKNYQNKNFTLLADIIDSFERSKYFKDIKGFSFSKRKNRDGDEQAPLNLKMKIQDPSIQDSRDIKIPVKISTEKNETESDKEEVDLIEIQNLDFLQELQVESTEKDTESSSPSVN